MSKVLKYVTFSFDDGVTQDRQTNLNEGVMLVGAGMLSKYTFLTDPKYGQGLTPEQAEEELKRILYDYGEERYAPQIASAICKKRELKPIETTLELVDIIRSAMPPAALREKQHPAKRSFQAIRIAVNDELGSVEKAMEVAIPLLNPGGRLAIITFHSLEDRIVKNLMKTGNVEGREEKDFYGRVNTPYRLVNRQVIVPSNQEMKRNPRSRSAKLRIAEKL